MTKRGANWSINYNDCNKLNFRFDMTKAEAKKVWKLIMMTFGMNFNMSAHCKEAYLMNNGKTVAMKNGDWWIINDQVVARNQVFADEATIDEMIAMI